MILKVTVTLLMCSSWIRKITKITAGRDDYYGFGLVNAEEAVKNLTTGKDSYHIWGQKVGYKRRDLTKLPDLNNDGYNDFVFASKEAGNGNLTILNGMNGTILEEVESLGYEPKSTVFTENRIVISRETQDSKSMIPS
ncbi:MAG: hypothetical protein GWN17_10700 [Candidatus Korarchaeota archaeon]|nr:hypothetical protein [Candidatus Korarchaeota archaeon]